MPDPDPQPPKPRAVSPARWLLLLLPSVVAISTPLIGNAADYFHIANSGDFFVPLLILNLTVAMMLCFGLGFRLEKWRQGEIKSVVWALNYGFMILFGNFAVTCFLCFPKLR